MKHWVLVLLLLTASASFAFADDGSPNDPAMDENGGGCSGIPWCSGSTMAVDPLSGISTVMYTLNSSIFVNGVVSGDLKITEQGQVGDLLRFEDINGVYEVFVFSDDLSGGEKADVGLPTVFQSNFSTVTEGSNGFSTLYKPTAGQAGYTGLTTGPYANTAYSLNSPGDVPEPSSLLLFGTGLLALAGIVRKVAI